MIRIPEKYFWPGMIIGILSFSVIANILLVMASRSDGGAQIIDNYYEKAVKWDEHQADLKRVSEMGWDVQILVGPHAEKRAIRFVMQDKNGTPLSGLTPHVVVTSPAKLEPIADVELVPAGPGVYATEITIPHNGFFDFELTAPLGDGDFVTRKRVEVLP